MNDGYDGDTQGHGRGRGRGMGRFQQPPGEEDVSYRSRYSGQPRRRSRSRSRSPERSEASRFENAVEGSSSGIRNKNYGSSSSSSDRKHIDEERRQRMARLRQENEEEEQRRAAPVGDDLDSQKDSSPERLKPTKEIIQVDPGALEGLETNTQMELLLGFSGGFGSTAGQKVEDNSSSAAQGAAAKNKVRTISISSYLVEYGIWF